MSEPDSYTIELRGGFDLNWADYLGSVLVHEQVEQGTIRTTTLVGHPRDAEAFLGILHLLIDRGFPVQAAAYRQATPVEGGVDDVPR